MKSGKLIRLRVDCVSNRPHAMANHTLQGTRGVYEACEWTAVALLSSLSVSNRGRAMDMPDFGANLMKEKVVKL